MLPVFLAGRRHPGFCLSFFVISSFLSKGKMLPVYLAGHRNPGSCFFLLFLGSMVFWGVA